LPLYENGIAEKHQQTVKRYTIYIICILVMVLGAVCSCSTSQNTPVTRFYHSFTARYNTYFNGHEAYKTGVQAQDQGNKDNFTEMLPVFAVSNKATAQIGKSNFETAVTKCEKAIKNHSIKRKPKVNRTKRRTAKQKNMLARKEYNPFLKNAWMLMGVSQFHKGDFIEAASTFSYINRLYAAEPDVLAESRAWLAACYSELDWFYDAEDIFRNKLGRDSVPHSAQPALNAAYADYYTRQKKYTEALPYLQKMAKSVRGASAKARLHFLLAQIYSLGGDKRQAYRELSKTIRQSPPYEVQLNARVMQAEVVSKSKSKAMLKRLNRMAKKSKNIKYCDQIYYAIGNILLTEGDTVKAIEAYEKGVSESTRNGVEKGALLLKLSELYYSRYDFTSCKRCLSRGISLINKERPDYDSIQKISKVINELEPHTAAVFAEDSVQRLAAMPEAEQNAVFDKAIELEKKRIRQERKKAAAAERKGNTGVRNAGNAAAGSNSTTTTENTASQKNDGKTAWYFYNPQAVESGKASFATQWGDRELADNWRRSNKDLTETAGDDSDTEAAADTTSAGDSTATARSKVPTDSTATAKDKTGSKEKGQETDGKKKDKNDEKLTREYYLKQLPVTEEQIAQSNKKIMEHLHEAGVIEKDKLGNLPLAEKTLTRVYTDYPEYEKMNDVLYQLYLLESQMGNTGLAQAYLAALEEKYPDDKFTKMLSDPNYEFDAKFGRQFEDSLYASTYEAFRNDNADEVLRNAELSQTRFPEGENRAKFIFLEAMANLRQGRRDSLRSKLETLTKQYSKDEITPLAQAILKGLNDGRVPGSGIYDIGSLWNRRTKGDAAVLDSIELARQLSPERNTPFNVIIAYPVDSVDENQLLYDVARYNFSNFAVRNFEIEQTMQEGLGEMIVKGFNNFSEAHSYAQKLYNNAPTRSHLDHAKLIVISKANMEKLGTDFSISDYLGFYERTFAPLNIKPELQLDKQIDIYQSEDDLPGNAEEENAEGQDESEDENTYPDDSDSDSNDGEWFDLE
jgi:tetratricopeptide (TPR) repeat protein